MTTDNALIAQGMASDLKRWLTMNGLGAVGVLAGADGVEVRLPGRNLSPAEMGNPVFLERFGAEFQRIWDKYSPRFTGEGELFLETDGNDGVTSQDINAGNPVNR